MLFQIVALYPLHAEFFCGLGEFNLCELTVLYHFNDKYAPFAGTSMTSLFENNRHFKKIRVFIMGENISSQNIEKFFMLSSIYQRDIVFLNINDIIKTMRDINMPEYRGSYAANMRLFVADAIPNDVDRLLYFDSDTIISGPLDELVNMNLENCPIAMVIDSLGFAHKKELKIKGNYYNSGTIVYQMNIWRDESYGEKIIDHIKNVRSHYPMPDQDLLNIVCEGKIKTLDPKYNLQPIHELFPCKMYFRFYEKRNYYSCEEIEEAVKNPVVYHFFRFCGEFPWNKNCVHPNRAIFDYYIERSPWKGYVKETANLNLSFKIEKMIFIFFPQLLFLFAYKHAHNRMVHKANQISLRNEVYSRF